MTKFSIYMLLAGTGLGFLIGIGVEEFRHASTPTNAQAQPEKQISKPTSYFTSKTAESSKTAKLEATTVNDGSPSLEVTSNEKSKGPPRSPKEIVDRLLSELENSDPKQPGTFSDSQRILARLLQLQDYGEEGSRAIYEFLQSQQDIPLSYNTGFGRGRAREFPSVRSAMLEVLYEMNDPVSKAASLDALKTSSSSLEVLLAARNLEKNSPGTYRAEALQAVNELLAKPQEPTEQTNTGETNGRRRWRTPQPNSYAMEIVGFYQAKEMIPAMEQLVQKQPELISQWANVLPQFGADDQVNSLHRLMSDEKLKKEVVQSGALLRLDLQNQGAKQLLQETFSKDFTETQKKQLVQFMSSGSVGSAPSSSTGLSTGQDFRRFGFSAPTKSSVENSLAFLDELQGQMNTPELQTTFQKTRESLVQRLQQLSQTEKR